MSEHPTAIKELQKKVDLLETVLQLSPVGIVAIDQEGRFILRNATARRLAPGSEDGLPSDWQEDFGMYHVDQKTPYREQDMPLARSLTEGTSYDDVEIFLKGPGLQDGILISVYSRPLKNEKGEIEGALCAFFDVTQRKNLQDSLKQAKSELEERVAARTQELEERDWLRQGQLELLDRTQQAQSLEALCQYTLISIAQYSGADLGALYLAREQQLHFEVGYGLPEGIDRTPFAFGERLTGLAASQRSIQRFVQPQQSITMPPHETIPSHLRIKNSFFEVLPEECLALPLIYDKRVIGVLELAFKQSTTERQMLYLQSICEPLALALGLQLSQLKVQELLRESQAQSLELQNRQEELEQSNAELEEQRSYLEEQREELQLLNVALKQSQKKLEQKAHDLKQASAYKSEFLASMSHELRTPLNSILILSQLLSENKKGNLEARQVESLRTIHQSGRDLLTLIDEILDMSKIEAGHLKIHHETFALQDLINKLNDRFKPMMNEKSLQFEVFLDTGCPEHLTSDFGRVEQILNNFLSNACRFTDTGSVKLSCSLEQDTLIFSVLDTGPGVASEKQELIFEAFQQGEKVMERSYGGTGLGLYIASKLAEKLGGHIELTRSDETGSCFSLCLPLVAPDYAPTSASTFSPSPMPQNASAWSRVLIIGDDPQFAEILKELCETAHFEVFQTASGHEAQAMALRLKPDAILLDLKLPDLHGMEVLKRLRDNPGTRSIPVQVISAQDKPAEIEALNVLGYFPKPLDPQDLNAVLHQIKAHKSEISPRILIVNEDPMQRHGLAKLLKEEADIFESRDEAEARVILQHEAPALMIWEHPPSEEFMVILRRVEQREQRRIPLILYTTDTDSHNALTASASIIVKGEKSRERLIDEVQLFLHTIRHQKKAESTQKEAKALSPEVMPPSTSIQGRRILLVDDDMRNIYALREFLWEQGCEVSVAKNGKEALEKWEEEKPDLILMDIMMPIMNGYDAIAALRQCGAQQPILALTAKAMPEDRQKCLQVGANDYLSKPVQLDLLLQGLHRWLNS